MVLIVVIVINLIVIIITSHWSRYWCTAGEPVNTNEEREGLIPHARRGGFRSHQAQKDQAYPPKWTPPVPPCLYC